MQGIGRQSRVHGKKGQARGRTAKLWKFSATLFGEVMELVAAGYKSIEIAKRLRITPATVDTHRRDLMRKLDLHSIADLTRYAIQHKLISGQA